MNCKSSVMESPRMCKKDSTSSIGEKYAHKRILRLISYQPVSYLPFFGLKDVEYLMMLQYQDYIASDD
jgi:hypothetical protein